MKINNFILAFILGLTKAFDKIDHEIMIDKLFKTGFRGPFYEFFKNYFTDRHKLVKIGQFNSNIIKTNYGVPEGFILGPIFFNIYINEIGFI